MAAALQAPLTLSAPAAAGLAGAEARAAACLDAGCRAQVARDVAGPTAASLSALPTGRAGVAAVTAWALREAGYPAPAAVAPSPSLDAALLSLYAAIGHPVSEALRADVARQVEAMAPAWRAALLPLVDALAASAEASRRIVAPEDRALLLENPALTAMLVSLAGSAPGPQTTDEMRALHAERAAALARVDPAALAAAAQPLADAVAAFRAPAAASASCAPILDLPFVLIGGECASDDTHVAAYVLQVDHGGHDTYLNSAGGGTGMPSVALDLGVGDDVYRYSGVAQGAALGSAGILYDEGGHDLYNASQFAQGSGNVGFGLLYDAGEGHDAYESPNGSVVTDLSGSQGSIGTKASAVGGVGILVDEGGDDRYEQNGLDGFVYAGAGGFGLMLERGGDDRYVSREVHVTLLGSDYGTFAGPIQVSAEAGGTAILLEEGGHDLYFMGPRVRQGGQGAAGVGALTLLLERSGSDAYVMGSSIVASQAGLLPFAMGQGGAYGFAAPPGPALAVLHDAAGDDVYVAEKWAQGFGSGSVGVLLDDGGADAYQTTLPAFGARGDGATWADGAAGAGVDSG